MAGPFQEIGAIAVRLTKCGPTGAPLFNNARGAFALCHGLSSFQFDHDIQDGQELYEEDGNGDPCVVRKRPSRVKRTTWTLTLCTRDHRVDEIMGVADAVGPAPAPTGKVVNVAQGCGGVADPDGFIIELWSERWDCNAADDDPYLRSILGRNYAVPSGYTKENGVAKPVYKGFSVPNPNFGDGPFGDLDELVGFADWSYAEVDDDALPTCPDSAYLPTPSGAS